MVYCVVIIHYCNSVNYICQVGGEDDDEPTLLWEGKGRQPVANSQAASDDLADVSAAMSSASMLFKKGLNIIY